MRQFWALLFASLVLALLCQRTNAITNFEQNIGRNCTTASPRVACGDELICDPTTLKCLFCTNDTQCTVARSQYQCKQVVAFLDGKTVNRGICTHKSLFPYISIWDILAALAIFVGGTLSGAGGIGGGGIFVPLLNLIGQFPPDLAVPLSKATIFGGAVCNVVILSLERHPTASHRPLIDYDTALMLEPATLLGTIIGVYFNVIFPNWLTVLLLILVLGNASINLFQKTYEAMKRETGWFGKKKSDNEKELQQGLLAADPEEDTQPPQELQATIEPTTTTTTTASADSATQTPATTTIDVGVSDDHIPQDMSSLTPEQREVLSRIIEDEQRTPILKLLILVACWFVVFGLSLLKGGHGAPSIANIQPCSFSYWFIGVLAFPLIGAVSIIIGVQLVRRYHEKKFCHYKFHDGDVEWSPWNTFYFPLLCAFAGTMAALLGIGGGMIKGPVLLDLGLDPHVASATSSLMILFTASITSAQYTVLGRLPLDYGLAFCSIGFLSSFMGQLIIGYPARKYKLTFIIILSIAVATVIATALMGGLGVYKVILDLKDGVYMGFNSLC